VADFHLIEALFQADLVYPGWPVVRSLPSLKYNCHPNPSFVSGTEHVESNVIGTSDDSLPENAKELGRRIEKSVW
jgi:hypothetical protein